MKNTQGILLIATSHPYYGRMAYNLAITLKAAESDMPIAIISDEIGLKHLTQEQKDIFDIHIPTNAGDGIKSVQPMRLDLPRLSPFCETLSLDVDMLWLEKKPSEIFALLDKTDFTAVNEGYTDLETMDDHTTKLYTNWAPVEAIKEAYGLIGKLYQLRGEVIAFRKTKDIVKFFATAKKIQAKPLLDPDLLGDSVTDEFSFNIAANQRNITPHEDGWQPTYWPARHGFIVPEIYTLYGPYYAFSLGGNTANRQLKTAHDFIVKAAAYKLGLPLTFPLASKREYLTDRIKY